MIKKILLILLLTVNFGVYAQSVTQTYIDDNKDLAIALMNEHHVPASIILAVAIHESASGTSKIARYLNNHFGIKGPNNSTQIKSAYRGFDEVKDSYNYFISFLQGRPKLNQLFSQFTDYDYKNWARGIQRGGYAASKTWASQITALIKKHNLQQFDNQPKDYIEPLEPVTIEKIYVVKKGDTLGSIAKKTDTTVQVLMLKNNLKSTLLRIGQTLAI